MSRQPTKQRRQRKTVGRPQGDTTVVEVCETDRHGDPRCLEVALRALGEPGSRASDGRPPATAAPPPNETATLSDEEIRRRMQCAVQVLEATDVRAPAPPTADAPAQTPDDEDSLQTQMAAYQRELDERRTRGEPV